MYALTNAITDRFISGYSSVARMKCHEPSNLRKTGFILVHGSKGMRSSGRGSGAADCAGPKLSAHNKQSWRVETAESL